MSLPEAIVYCLATSNRGMSTERIAEMINAKRLHVRKDGQPVTGKQVYAVAMHYPDMFCNFMGQVCLLNACLFGAVATLMTWVVYPALQKLYLRAPKDIKTTLFVGVVVFYAVVICLYMVNLNVPL